MSADEFDPFIERLFARTPHMPDAPLFTAQVEQRLQHGSRIRFLALSLAGLFGGAVALRETLSLDINLGAAEAPAARALDQSVQSATLNLQDSIRSGLEQAGLAGLEWGSMGGMQMFWIAAGALIVLAAAGVMKLSQEI